jgi:type IV pilus assembly protein PilB
VLTILNTTKVNIITLEDPVEYFISGVNQSQINPEIGLTFATGLRSILRQDPNVIMVGEVRDKETAELAVHAALTGHLVFSTLHTNDSVGAIPRLIDLGVEPFLLGATINAVAAQRLVRKICGDCAEEILPTQIEITELQKGLSEVPADYLKGYDLQNIKVKKGKGCEKCELSGYRGRLAIFEVLPMEPNIQELVMKKSSPFEIYKAAKQFGMITMKQDGFLKVLSGETSVEEVVRVTTE